MRNNYIVALILSIIVLITATSCSGTPTANDTLQQPSEIETVDNDSNEITPEAENSEGTVEAATESTIPEEPHESNASETTPEIGIQDETVNTDNQEEVKTCYEIYYVDGVSHINIWMPFNYVTMDSGCPTGSLRYMYAYADAVIIATLEEYHGELYDSTIYHMPVTVSVEKVIKGEITVGEDLLFGYFGGPMTIEQYKELVDPDFVDDCYPEDTIVDYSFGGQKFPETGKRYLLFLEMLGGEITSEKNTEMKYVVLGMNEGLYYLTDGTVSQGVNNYGVEQTVIANLMDKEWLTYVEKPDWAISITYIPEGMGLSMKNSGSSDTGYRMIYNKAPCDEYPNGIGYSIEQSYNEDEKREFDVLVSCLSGYDKSSVLTISEISVRLVKLMNFRNDMVVYFTLPNIEVLIEGVYVTDETELLKIAEAMINEYNANISVKTD